MYVLLLKIVSLKAISLLRGTTVRKEDKQLEIRPGFPLVFENMPIISHYLKNI